MFAQYQRECSSGRLVLGDVMPWRDPTTGQVVYNLATQDRPGRHASLAAVESALAATIEHAERHGVTRIALPRLGAGIGGLKWADVEAVIERVAGPSPVEVTIVSLPRR